jgi:hypothetical protein
MESCNSVNKNIIKSLQECAWHWWHVSVTVMPSSGKLGVSKVRAVIVLYVTFTIEAS